MGNNNFVFIYITIAFLWDAIFHSNSFLKVSSLFLLTYAFLDNFGMGELMVLSIQP